MVEMFEITCSRCGIVTHKPKKEIERRRRKGAIYFYCSLKCAGTSNMENLKQSGRANFDVNHLRTEESKLRWRESMSKRKNPFREYIRRCKNRKHQDFDLDLKYLETLWKQQDGRCAITGIPLFHDAIDKNQMPSLDRINNDFGYVRGNVQFVCCRINYAKNDGTDDEIVAFLHLLFEHAFDKYKPIVDLKDRLMDSASMPTPPPYGGERVSTQE